MIKIPIVLASDENYIFPAAVAIASALQNAEESTKYQFFLLVSQDTADECRNFMYQLEKQFPQLELSFIIVDDNMFENATIALDYTTIPTYYRLAIADILKEYDKCIYLDCDVLVMADLSLLYMTDICDFYLGGVRDWDQYSDHCRELKLPTLDYYINAGVLVMNLRKIREDQMFLTFQQHMDKGYPFADQDVLNVCCWDKIKILPTTYNLQSVDFGQGEELGEQTDYYINGSKTGVRGKIIHYASGIVKPWNNFRFCGCREWWYYAGCLSDTPQYQHYFGKLQQWHKENDWDKIIFRLSKQDKIFIFGFTYIAKDLYDALYRSGIRGICCFCDNDINKSGSLYRGIPVLQIQEALNKYGKAYIINAGQKRFQEINEQLLAMGIPEERVWRFDYSPRQWYYFRNLDKQYYRYELIQILWKEYGVDTTADQERYELLLKELQQDEKMINRYCLKEWLLKES